jgi:hypothetical protein
MPTHLIVELVELHTRCKARETSNEIQIHRRAAGLTFHATEYNVSSITEQYVVISSTTTELHHIYIYMQQHRQCGHHGLFFLCLKSSGSFPATHPFQLYSQVLATARLARLQLTVIVWNSC